MYKRQREDYAAYRDAAGLTGSAPEMDAVLHAERAVPRQFEQNRHVAEAEGLPDGSIILDEVPRLVLGDAMFEVRPDGYGPPRPRPQGKVTVLTPPLSRKALAGGYVAELAI